MRFSIITPSLNQAAYLPQTMQSIFAQTGPFDLQWIVADGGSTDGTARWLKGINDPRLTWSSARDQGQSDAVNKGLALADGDVIGWLNSDDLYAPGALASVAEAFAAHPDAQWLIGRCQIIDERGKVIRHAVSRYKDRLLDRYSYRDLLRQNPISQPAVFWRREFGARVGKLDTGLQHAMDYDLWLRMARLCAPLITGEVIALFRWHAASKSGTQTRQRFSEQYQVACRYFEGDRLSRWAHRFNVVKIVLGYLALRLLRR